MILIRRRSFWILSATLSVLHLGATFGFIFVSFNLGMYLFDRPDMPAARLANDALRSIANILTLPLTPFWHLLFPQGGSLSQWTVLLANSCIWGVTLAILIHWLAPRFRQPRPAVGPRGGGV